jgi:hypothetical protein
MVVKKTAYSFMARMKQRDIVLSDQSINVSSNMILISFVNYAW